MSPLFYFDMESDDITKLWQSLSLNDDDILEFWIALYSALGKI